MHWPSVYYLKQPNKNDISYFKGITKIIYSILILIKRRNETIGKITYIQLLQAVQRRLTKNIEIVNPRFMLKTIMTIIK